jgi:hypothetical protein
MRHPRSLQALIFTLSTLCATPARAGFDEASELIHGLLFIALVTLPILVLLGFGVWLLVVSLRNRAATKEAPDPPRPSV